MIENTDFKNKKIILDVDTGIDDALAIILLCKHLKDNVIGITTCGGNVGIQQTTKNTLAVLSLLKLDILVFKGSDKPIKKESYVWATDYHGDDGLCNTNMETLKIVQKENAQDFIIESAKKYKDNLVLISTAPPTNIASAILKDNSLKNYLKCVFLMGGAVNVPGNQTEYAEFNFFQDPEAVRIIFENIKNVSIIPLDVTNKCLIEEKEIENFNKRDAIGNFVVMAIKNWYGFFGKPKGRKFELYDPLAVSAALGDFLSFKIVKMDIDTKNDIGALIEGDFSISYAYKVNRKKFVGFFFNSLKI